MQDLSTSAVTHVAVDMNGVVIISLEKFVEMSALFGFMTPAKYSWGDSAYVQRSDGNRPEFKLLTLLDMAKLALSDPE
jgi:hypothetical protein